MANIHKFHGDRSLAEFSQMECDEHYRLIDERAADDIDYDDDPSKCCGCESEAEFSHDGKSYCPYCYENTFNDDSRS